MSTSRAPETTSEWYTRFATREARGVSPLYESWALAVLVVAAMAVTVVVVRRRRA